MMRTNAVVLAALVSGAAVAQTLPPLYAPGRPVADQKIRLRPWGSGIITETQEAAFEGATSIRVASRNFFQGGTLIFDAPVALGAAYGDKANLLRVVYKTLDSTTGSTGGPGGTGAPGAPGGRGGGAVGGRGGSTGAPGGVGGPGGGSFGGPGGGSFGGGRGGAQGGSGSAGGGMSPGGMSPGGMSPGGMGGGQGTTKAVALRTMRLVVTTTDNLRSEAYIPVATSSAAQNGWRQVGIPLQAIRGFERTNKTVKEITVAGDSSGAFYLGDLRVVNDPTPIRAEITGSTSLNLALNDVVTISASGTGGSSVLKYAWDFDDTDGISVDAEGRSISHKFRKVGTFTVTLTVSDEYGLKEPYTTTIKVKVNG